VKRKLAAHARDGELCEKLDGDRVRCFACGHRCLILPGHDGVCRVRWNEAGTLRVPFGYTAAVALDPIEKKPFFHVFPGSTALSFGMLGCDFHCAYCQNWEISQAGRDPAANSTLRPVSANQLAGTAADRGARVLVSTYNEPLITSEWAVAVFREAKARGLTTGYVSNGNVTPEVLDYIRPWTDLYKVDLKGFSDGKYRTLGGNLSKVTDGIRLVFKKGFWLEVVTLVVPGFNDSEAELRDIARFLRSVSPDVPWHVTAFHKDYRMTDPEETPVRTLVRAAEIGRSEGLNYVYAGNLPGRVGKWEDTACPTCGTLLVERHGFRVARNRLAGSHGHCPGCGAKIPGRWG
jgi:pyruvate formate lyase activating enzyme